MHVHLKRGRKGREEGKPLATDAAIIFIYSVAYFALAVFQLEIALHEQVSVGGHGATFYGIAQVKHFAVVLHHPVQWVVVGILQ